MKCKAIISEVIIDKDKIQPTIVTFPNGTLKNDQAKKLQCNYYYDKKQNNILLGMANGQMVYKGHRPKNEEYCQTMLGIHNRRTGKIRLISADRWQVSPVSNELPNYRHLDDDINTQLNKQFGSKKTKRRVVQIGKMKVTTNAVKDQLEKTVTNIEISQESLHPQIPDTSSYILPCNKDAQAPEDVYNLYDIIPADKLELLQNNMDQFWIDDSESKSEYIMKTMKSIEVDPQRNKKLALLEFIYGVCKWISMHPREFKRRSNEISKIPEISTLIVDSYSAIGASGRTRPQTVRDRAVIHSIILALMINNFKLDLELFSKNFSSSLGTKKLTELTRMIGAVSVKDNKNMVILKTPLPVIPDVLMKRKRRN